MEKVGDNVTLFNLPPKDAYKNYKEFFEFYGQSKYAIDHNLWHMEPPYFSNKEYSSLQEGNDSFNNKYFEGFQSALNSIEEAASDNPIKKKLVI